MTNIDKKNKLKIFILGGEGNGMVIGAYLLIKYPSAQIAFLNDVDEIGREIGIKKKIPVIGRTDEVGEWLKNHNSYVISAYGGFTNPMRTLKRLKSLGIPDEKWIIFVHDTAIVPYEFCDINTDVFIGPLCQTSPNVVIGSHCSMFGNSFIGHDSVIGDFCHLASNCVVGASVKVGVGVHIGLNSVIRENINIGDYAIIGAGSVVVKDVPENAIVVGNPARILKYRD